MSLLASHTNEITMGVPIPKKTQLLISRQPTMTQMQLTDFFFSSNGPSKAHQCEVKTTSQGQYGHRTKKEKEKGEKWSRGGTNLKEHLEKSKKHYRLIAIYSTRQESPVAEELSFLQSQQNQKGLTESSSTFPRVRDSDLQFHSTVLISFFPTFNVNGGSTFLFSKQIKSHAYTLMLLS